MIWYYLRLAFTFIARLLLPMPASATARVRPDSPCPACGARANTVRCVLRGSDILVQHTCSTCGARWHENTVVKVDASLVLPAIPRTDLELKEERSVGTGSLLPVRPPQPVKPVEVRMPPVNTEPAVPVIVQPAPSGKVN